MVLTGPVSQWNARELHGMEVRALMVVRWTR
jgi:hypothetical protein